MYGDTPPKTTLLLLLLLQVWNINPVVGIVGVFNLHVWRDTI
jgi:hypothetical protein